jgi:hypothetical protein
MFYYQLNKNDAFEVLKEYVNIKECRELFLNKIFMRNLISVVEKMNY